MDNISHSFAGLAVGELIHRSLTQESTAEQQGLRRRLILITCGLASNFPDLDLVLTPLLPEPLGYLLHHRGHTHTLLYAIPQAMLLWAAIWLLWPAARQLVLESKTARLGFGMVLCAGFLLHLMMDYLNSYGIHPFHPIDSRWFYGDMVFIIEPLFWILFGVPMIMVLQNRVLKACFLMLLAGVMAFFAVREYLPWTSLAVLTAIAVIVGILQYRAGDRGIVALISSSAFAIAFIGMQGAASIHASEAVMRQLQREDASARFLDASMTSFPTNPLCWTFVSIESKEHAGIYRLRRGLVTLAPGVMPIAACPDRFADASAENAKEASVHIYSTYEGELEKLRALARNNCHFNAWLRFARAPRLDDSRVSDLRFFSSLRGNFTTMDLEDFKDRECAPHIPQWGFPRQDLLLTSGH